MARLLILIIVLAAIVGVILFTLSKVGNRQLISLNNPNSSSSYWIQDQSAWKPVGTPPPCPNPLVLGSITDVNKATSVLYPGQMRSVGYEPTAGFRFDGLSNDKITVMAPMDGEIVRASRFLIDGELQYVFDILSACGIMNRFDHLLELPPKLQAIVDKLPTPKENDSRSESVYPPVAIQQGEILATAVGLRKNNNTFISWTVFDFRQKNKISQNPAWAKDHPELDHYVICPFSYLSEAEKLHISSLPAADILSGSKSDFCN